MKLAGPEFGAARRRGRTLLFAAAMAGAAAFPAFALAAGAMAIGVTGNFPGDGIGIAGTAGEASQAAATQKVLSDCRNNADSTAAGANCKIVATFSGQCFAFAGAKRSTLVGYGWAVANSKSAAESRAIADCQRRTGGSAASLCVAGFSACD